MSVKRLLSLLCAFALSVGVAEAVPAALLASRSDPLNNRITLPNLEIDVRQTSLVAVAPTAEQIAAARALGANVRWDIASGVPKTVLRHGAALTPEAGPGFDATQIAKSFVADNASLWRLNKDVMAGLEVAALIPSPNQSASHVWFQQTEGGVEVFGANLGVTVDRDGRVIWAGGVLWPEAVNPDSALIPAAEAPLRAAGSVGSLDPEIQSPARRVVFPLAGSGSRPAWHTVVKTGPHAIYESVVDGRTGEILFRRNQVHTSSPQGTVFQTQNPNVVGATRLVTSFSGIDGSWVTDNQTVGNNVTAYHAPKQDGSQDYTPTTPASGDPEYQHFDYPFANAIAASMGTDWVTDRDATVTQAFYYTNLVHDRLYPLGFDEQSRNFQQDNFGRGGAGGDPVIVKVDYKAGDGSCCNAFFSTPGDGSSPTMEVYIETPGGGVFGHGAFDGDTVFHEYGHGVHNRLVNGGMGMGAGEQTGALGEGWGDSIAFSMWNDPILFEYVTTNQTTGLRRVAYDTSPLTYSSMCDNGTCEVHDDGEIWATALWDVRTHLITRYGLGAGVTRFEQLMVDGMKSTPSSPTFLDARDGILTSDSTIYGNADYCGIWNAFAINGMGVSASSPTQTAPVEAFDVPSECIPTADANGPYNFLEGATQVLDGTGSSPGTHPSTGTLSYAWNFDTDGQFDDATGATPTIGPFGDNQSFMIGLQVTNSAGISATANANVVVSNANPMGDFVPVLPASIPEGSFFTADLRFSDPGWLDTYTATINWGDGTVEPISPVITINGGPGLADSGFVAASHAYGDNGTYSVIVSVRDDDGGLLVRTHELVVTNVNPSLSFAPGQITAIDEGGSVTVNGLFSDPGWLDTYTASIDWGTGEFESITPVITTEGSPGVSDQGTLSASHAYGDNGVFQIALTIRDDDGGETQQVFDLNVGNLDPTASIDPTGSAGIFGGLPTWILTAGGVLNMSGSSTDAGSEDLLAEWGWGDGSFTTTPYLLNPPTSDPFPSPSVDPRAITDPQSHLFGDACLYEITFRVSDDDGGVSPTQMAVAIVQGNATLSRSAGYWYNQYRGATGNLLDEDTRLCYLMIAGHLSTVFHEVTDASTFGLATSVLKNAGPIATEALDRQLLAAWLNFANGAFDLDSLVDTNGDGIPDATFGDAVMDAEDARLDTLSTPLQIRNHAATLERINGGL